ncbi:MAG: metallophosphoesterase family protein [Solimonas sp.]
MHTPDKRPRGKRLLRFAVIADTHVNQAEDEASSFFPLNRLANARSRHVVEMLRGVDAEFVLHLGDIVHPIPGLATYADAARCYRQLYANVDVPIHLTPGNHDIGDKPAKSAPVATVTSEFVNTYRETFGEPWYSFDQAGFHFVVINAPVINSELPEEQAQREWLEADLAAHSGERVFVAIHYPPYVWRSDEPGNYDNLDEPGRSWLLGLFERHAIEAVFCGHVHNFWYDQHGNTEIYLAPSTAFVRQDYSEFMRVCPPGDEGGRADVDKLGFFVVDVHEQGHVAMWVRSNGELRPPEGGPPVQLAPFEIHTKTAAIANVGVDLRHPWVEVVELPPSGALEEFERKRARNDYPLCAVWDMGLALLRVPIQDLIDTDVRDRMRIAHSVGNRFIVSTLGVPQGQAAELLAEHAHLLDSIEVTLPFDEMHAALPPMAELRRATGTPIHLAKLRRHEDSRFDGLRYGHLIFYGWVPQEWEQIADVAHAARDAGAFDGLVFRVGRGASPMALARDLVPRLRGLGLELSLAVRLAGDDPAGTETDDRTNAQRVEETVMTAMEFPQVRCVLDTLIDIDRGYFLRHGLLDRAYNLRPAGEVLRSMGAHARRARFDSGVLQ